VVLFYFDLLWNASDENPGSTKSPGAIWEGEASRRVRYRDVAHQSLALCHKTKKGPLWPFLCFIVNGSTSWEEGKLDFATIGVAEYVLSFVFEIFFIVIRVDSLFFQRFDYTATCYFRGGRNITLDDMLARDGTLVLFC
jgi:hypothetical protein